MSTRRLYRNPDKGKIMGVCAGLGDFFDVDPNIIRVFWIIAIFMSFFLAVLIYLALGMILPQNPGNTEQIPLEEFRQRLEAVNREVEQANADLTRLESYVTSDAFDFQRKIWNMQKG